MTLRRYLCSHLVRLSVGTRVHWANLEEIWNAGAILECEEEVTPGDYLTVSCDEISFDAKVTALEWDGSGWRVEVLFSEHTPWTMELWTPEHVLDPETLYKAK
jgi:hypothetical protein